MKGTHYFSGLPYAFTESPKKGCGGGGRMLPEMDCFIIAASQHVHEKERGHRSAEEAREKLWL